MPQDVISLLLLVLPVHMDLPGSLLEWPPRLCLTLSGHADTSWFS
jgi:hypothetical protein